MKVGFLDLERAYSEVASSVDERLLEVAGSGSYILGKNAAALEEAVAAYLGLSHAVGVGSGTDALHLALATLGLGAGDEVITTPFTFAATVEAIEYIGAQPVLVDIDPDTFNIDPAMIEVAVTENTRAILPVHIFGMPADMHSIQEIARRHNLKVIEDCAQCFGARLDGKPAGSMSDAAALSFYPTKTLGGLGDGGMIATDNTETYNHLRQLRNHGIADRGEHVELGFNSRLDEIQAAVLRVKLERIDNMNGRRRKIAAHYDEVLIDAGAKVQKTIDGFHNVYGYYTLCVNERDQFRMRLADAGVSTALYYGKPLHKHAHFSTSCQFGALPVAERIATQCVSLPIFPEMSDAEVDHVATAAVEALT